ncbi:hypothetical protein ACFY8B_04140 [Streptomyces sp. NPDC012751]|uniref:hypothetical protein n=1 Tax=Streptomyces sp. NPDC012751 TaxID=3364846 RepID=UPI0036863B54
MSTEREYEVGADGTREAGGTPGTGPNVYHPRPAAAPAYEEYADPAAAHGWQSAYDETRELPPVPAGPAEGRAGRRRAARRTGGRRRVAAVSGALAVAGTAAVIAVLAGQGPSERPRPADGGGAAGRPAVRGGVPAATTPPAPAPTTTAPATTFPASAAPPPRKTRATTPAVSATTRRPTPGPTPTVTASPSNPPTPTPTPVPGTPRNRGHGHTWPNRPR